MRFLVDGQNAIHRLHLQGGGITVLRAKLLARVRLVAPRGALVCFDGHPAPGAFGRSEVDGVEYLYSGDREADEDIADLVRAAKCPSHTVVVTDDLELARRVEQLGAQSLRVIEFFAEDDGTVVPHPEPSYPASPGLTPADFGLPDVVDLAAPPPEFAPKSLPRLRPGGPAPVVRVPAPPPIPRGRGESAPGRRGRG